MKTLDRKYDELFYSYNVKGSLKSAELFLGYLFDKIKFSSVIDIGCGRGTWLKAAHELGVSKLVGLDGFWNDGKLLNENIDFKSVDLENLNFDDIDDKYELAISLEVAEHITEKNSTSFIKYICSKSDMVLFSAASKFQGGTNHLNEQFPSYWAKLFLDEGYYPIDLLRPKFWGNKNIEACYRQNSFVYLRKNSNVYKLLTEQYEILDASFMDCLHPEIYLNRSGSGLVKDFFSGMKSVLSKKIYKIRSQF